MAIISSGIYPINPNVTDGTQLAGYINELVTAINSNQASVTRPPLISKGGIWTKLIGDNEVALMIYDGTVDNQVATVVDGIINIEGIGTGGNPLLVAGDAIYLNANTINEDYAIPDGYNGMSAGVMNINATVDVGNGTWTIVGEGGGETATLESLGIPNHDKMTVDGSGWLAVNGALQSNSDNESHVLFNTGAGETKAQVTYKHSESALNFHNSGQVRMSIGADGKAQFNDGVTIKPRTGSDTLKLEQSNTVHGWLVKANEADGHLEFVRYGSEDGLKYSWGHNRCDINVPLYVQGNPKSIDVVLSDVETKLADRDKIIDKLMAKVDALETKLKKVK